jgi:enoyl-CoA hydratase/carnithine racemase
VPDFCTVTRDEQPFIVTMNRPEKRNSMPPESHLQMGKIWDESSADPNLAKELARSILRGAPLGIAASKQVADMALYGKGLAEILAEEDGEPKQSVMRSADLLEGIKAFLDKREPQWQGR